MIRPPMLADWYRACDVLLSPGNEGFGLPAIEAQACGTPVILGDWGTGPELAGDGWLVPGELWWNDIHQADWHDAGTPGMVAALEEAYEMYCTEAETRSRRDAARDNALTHDIGKIVRDHWEPVLGALE
jgi:glycosyltransferase involved in cell wall biosynthesis